MALHRRDFLVLSGAGGVGLLLGCRLGCNKTPEKLGAPPEISDDSQKWFNAWVAIGADDRVYLRIHEAEMGQGILTGLAMALAEELDVEWSSVQAEHAPADSARYGRQSTGGSTSTRDNHAMLRKMGAAARHMLVQAAAQAWGVPAVECTTTPGQVRHAASARQTRYGALVNEAAKLPVPEAPKLKAAADFQLLGSSPPRLDIPTKVTGETQYGIDVRRPNMLFGVVARAPHFGATVKSFDDAPARQVLGVQDVLQIPSGVLVLADHTWAALRGREALKVQWNASEHAELNDQSIREQLVRAIPKGRAARDDGDVKTVLHKAQQRIEAVYEVPYLAHACLEPVNCTAEVTTDGCEVWVGTQSPTATQQTAAEICGIPTERVKVHSMMLGGGFGRRSHTDFVSDAVFAAKAARRPVQVLWTREDDTRGGHYRPVGYNTLSGALDAEGWFPRLGAFVLPNRHPRPKRQAARGH
ncbi:MAG: molybdopterin cofactor-binding domain-containing protein [Myxococcota bacterium]